MPRRRALFAGGSAMMVVGAVLTGIGIAVYVRGVQRHGSCSDPAEVCSAAGSFDQVDGGVLMGLGVPHLVAGIALIGAGAATHR